MSSDVQLHQIKEALGCKASVYVNGYCSHTGRIVKAPEGDKRAEFSVAYRGIRLGKICLMYTNLYPECINEWLQDGNEVVLSVPKFGGGVYDDQYPKEVPKVDAFLKEIGL
jgi:hypothetical protein